MALARSEFNERRVKRYEEFWNLLEKHDVSTPVEYLAGAFEGSEPLPVAEPQEVVENQFNVSVDELNNSLYLDNKSHRHWLSRFYPYNEQEVFLGLEEPLLGESLETNEHLRLASADLDPEQLASISSNYYVDYLAGEYGSNNKTNDFLELLESIDTPNNSIGPESSYPEYFQVDGSEENDRFHRNVDPTKGVWADFYVSNARMLGNFTDVSFKNYTRYNRNLNNSFVDEIEGVDPSLVVLSGRTAWNAVRYSLEEQLTPVVNFAPTPSGDIGEVHGSLYKDSTGRLYLPIRHLGRLSTWPDNDRLEESGKEAAGRLT